LHSSFNNFVTHHHILLFHTAFPNAELTSLNDMALPLLLLNNSSLRVSLPLRAIHKFPVFRAGYSVAVLWVWTPCGGTGCVHFQGDAVTPRCMPVCQVGIPSFWRWRQHVPPKLLPVIHSVKSYSEGQLCGL